MRRVVQGMHFRSRGIVSCRLQKTPRYDHKQHYAGHAAPGETESIWDFVVNYEDASEVYFHPNYSNPKFDSWFEKPKEDWEIPKTGKGGTSGPGTYQRLIKKDDPVELRFDAANKWPTTLPNRSHGNWQPKKGGKKKGQQPKTSP